LPGWLSKFDSVDTTDSQSQLLRSSSLYTSIITNSSSPDSPLLASPSVPSICVSSTFASLDPTPAVLLAALAPPFDTPVDPELRPLPTGFETGAPDSLSISAGVIYLSPKTFGSLKNSDSTSSNCEMSAWPLAFGSSSSNSSSSSSYSRSASYTHQRQNKVSATTMKNSKTNLQCSCHPRTHTAHRKTNKNLSFDE
jgi:hypothetical protein